MLAVKVFTLAFDPILSAFNDEPVREFLADKDVESVSDHFFTKDGTPFLALVARYRLAVLPATVETGSKQGRLRDESWRNELAKEHWPLFNTLRDWRGERAKREGIPSYVICNNRQLVEVLAKRPASLAELGQVDGFGEAKLKKYGTELLALLARAGPSEEPTDAA